MRVFAVFMCQYSSKLHATLSKFPIFFVSYIALGVGRMSGYWEVSWGVSSQSGDNFLWFTTHPHSSLCTESKEKHILTTQQQKYTQTLGCWEMESHVNRILAMQWKGGMTWVISQPIFLCVFPPKTLG